MSQAEKSKAQNLFLTFLLPSLSILLVAGLLIVFNGGIRLGFSNHTGLLPVVRRLLDASYLPDHFGISLRLFHHRSFAYLVAAFSKLFGEDNALISLNLLGNIFLSASLLALCRSLKLSILAFIAVGLFLALSVGWTGWGLETNTFVGNREIMPTTLAHASVLLATASLLRERLRLAAFFAGLVAVFHLQIGFAFALILLPFFAVRVRALGWKEALLLVALFMIPVSIPLWEVSQMLNRGLVTNPFTLADIYFRQPGHFELKEPQAAVWFIAHLCLQIIVFIWLRRTDKTASDRLRVLLLISVFISALSAIHFLDYYYLKIGALAKFQFLRMSVIVTVFGALSLVFFLNTLARKKSTKQEVFVNICLIVIASLLYSIPATRQGVKYSFEISRYAEQNSDWIKACLWLKENSPKEALFLTPPGNEGFTYLSGRANIGEFKINPDGAQYLAQWYERLRDLAGGELPNQKGFANIPLLNKAYASLNQEQMVLLRDKYQADYAVLPKSSSLNFEIVFENNGYKIFKLTN
jgi:hypothetical protein